MKVAFGKISITPSDVSKIAMAGYTRPHFANGKLDDVCARAVLMEDIVDGNIKKRFLMISLDVLKVPMVFCQLLVKDEIKKAFVFFFGARTDINSRDTYPQCTGSYGRILLAREYSQHTQGNHVRKES